MANYHVGCGITGIFAGTLNKKGDMWVNKSDVTEEASSAVAQFLLEHGKVMEFNYQGKRYRLAVEPQESVDNKEKERQKYFAYLDGVADGLNESRNDVNSVLNKIRIEIEMIIGEHDWDDYDFCSGLICARKIIDKYKAEIEPQESEE